jgi:hypothetical protein
MLHLWFGGRTVIQLFKLRKTKPPEEPSFCFILGVRVHRLRLQSCFCTRVRAAAAARAAKNNYVGRQCMCAFAKPTMVLKNRDVLKAQRKATKGLKAVAHPAIRCASSPPPPLSPYNLLLSVTPNLCTASFGTPRNHPPSTTMLSVNIPSNTFPPLIRPV